MHWFISYDLSRISDKTKSSFPSFNAFIASMIADSSSDDPCRKANVAG